MFSKTTDSVAEETDIQRLEQNNQPDNSEAWGERPKYVSMGTVGSVPLGSYFIYHSVVANNSGYPWAGIPFRANSPSMIRFITK